MKFLTETVENLQVDIQESSLGIKDYYITGIFMQSGVRNKNGRIYPPEVLAKEMNRYITEQIKTNRSVGELNHPNGPNINLDKVSHKITDLWVEGNNIYGKAKILNTPQGQIVKTLIDEGVQLGVSTRGFGSVQERNGTKIVQPDFRLATIDIVQDPSCQSAYVSTLMESKEFFVDDEGNIRERDGSLIVEQKEEKEEVQEVDEKCNKMNEAELLEKFEKAMNEISKKTLGSYVKKAAKDVEAKATNTTAYTADAEKHLDNAYRSDDLGLKTSASSHRQAADMYHKFADQEAKKLNKRQKGIFKAVNKLAESTSKPTKDDLDPHMMFQTHHTKLLTKILKDKTDLIHGVKSELATRGLDSDGKWVGFEKAKEHHFGKQK